MNKDRWWCFFFFILGLFIWFCTPIEHLLGHEYTRTKSFSPVFLDTMFYIAEVPDRTVVQAKWKRTRKSGNADLSLKLSLA